jgi:hypothetical protein
MTTNDNVYFRLRKNYKEAKFNLDGYWSYPIYSKISDNICWMYYISSFDNIINSKKTIIYRPHALLVTLPDSDEIIHYQNFKIGFDPFPKLDWDRAIGQFPFNEVRDLTIKQLEDKEIELVNLCKKNNESFNKSGAVDEKMKDSNPSD